MALAGHGATLGRPLTDTRADARQLTPTRPPPTTHMATGTLLYAQSGGVTAVINATAAAVIQAARARKVKVLAARNGILGVLRE